MCSRRRAVVELVACIAILVAFVAYFGWDGGDARPRAGYWLAIVNGAGWTVWSMVSIARGIRSEYGFVYWTMDHEGIRSPDFGALGWDDITEVSEIKNPWGRTFSAQDKFVVRSSKLNRAIVMRRCPPGTTMAGVRDFAARRVRRNRRG